MKIRSVRKKNHKTIVTKYALLNGCLLNILLIPCRENLRYDIHVHYAAVSKNVLISADIWSGVYFMYFAGFFENDVPRYLLWNAVYSGTIASCSSFLNSSRKHLSGTEYER